MTIKIEVHQKRIVEEGPLYKVQTDIIYSSGIDRNVFVFNTETQEYNHVATVWDMETFPNNRDEALLNDKDYYRQSACEMSYDEIGTANDAAIYLLGRIQYLIQEYDVVAEGFIGENNYTFEV